ncbi:hypothetical protein PRIPAC_90385 [Pristionchus pacificus]|uniref:Zinc finger protein n=1 Tax=Pristionchus pacificus TaxID=54126 RepID=A0A2A6CWC6_PRIPA|nr:hypothetical protein PRIPAC_90385 [Pristionchus pacificus]|eukprot:PDM82400.1 zinc finger protein [Pristionchus pacificus]
MLNKLEPKRRHLENEEEKNLFKCEECNKGFCTSRSLKNHKITHLPDGERPEFECDVCFKRFKHKSSLTLHKKLHLAGGDPRKKPPPGTGRFECDICGNVYTLKGAMEVHRRCHAEDEDTRLPFQCEECGRRFAMKATMLHHCRTLLPADDPNRKKYECKICGKFLSGEISEGQATYTGTKTSICPMTIQTWRSMIAPYVGKNCTVRTEWKPSVSHLSEDDPRREKYRFDICGKFLDGKSSLALHKESHLDENDPDQAAKKRPFQCEICDKSFRGRRNLRHHMSVHTGEYHLQCALCNEGFNRKRELDKHAESHKNGKLIKSRRRIRPILNGKDAEENGESSEEEESEEESDEEESVESGEDEISEDKDNEGEVTPMTSG